MLGHLSIKPQAKMRRYYDGHGLYLQVTPQGRRYWRMKYHIKVADKRKERLWHWAFTPTSAQRRPNRHTRQTTAPLIHPPPAHAT